MNRAVLLLISLFLTKLLSAQSTVPAIKIYLHDAISGKKIADAKVNLEGFEITSIQGKYNPTENYYYFDSIPKGYTTVMAYHKGYNEKGYQNPNQLPKELKLKLYTLYRVKIPGDTLNFYKEDRNKIAVVFEDIISDENSFTEYLITNYPKLVLLKAMEANMRYLFFLTKKNKKDFKRFNDPEIKKLSEDKNIISINSILLKTEINMPKYQIYKEYFYENGKPNYIERYIKYVNHDTLDRPRYNRYNKHGNINAAIKTINTDNNSDDTETAPVKPPKVNDLLLSYKEKYKKRLLHNDVYMLHQNELDSLYAIAEKRYEQKQFYDYESTSNVKIVTNFSNYTFMPTDESHYIPYIAVSNIIVLRRKEAPKKDPNVLFSQTFKFVTPEDEKTNFYSRQNLEIFKNNNFNLSDYRGNPSYYKTKQLIASPFGISDVIEITENQSNDVTLEIVKYIGDPSANR